MDERLALITHQALESNRLSGERDQPGCAIAAGKMKNVGPGQMLRFMGRDGARGLPADARMGGRVCNAHGYGSAHERAGEAKARAGEVG